MKALIIYRVDIANPANQGVSKKMQGHLYGLMQNGYDVDVIYISENGLYLNQNCLFIFNQNTISKGIFKAKTFYRVIKKRIVAQEYDLVLFRFHLVMNGMLRLFSMLKNHHPKIKIVIDMPTFPYEKEWKGIKGKVLLKVDEKNRQRLKMYVDFIIHYGKEKEIWGIPCINSSNGIMISHKKMSNNISNNDRINLIAIGKWDYWHGLDRILTGIVIYNKNKPTTRIHLHVVGDGTELSNYKTYADNNKIESYLTFHGSMHGEELETIFNLADVGIGNLGNIRRGIFVDSALKHRTYCERGIPFILCTKDLDFDKDLDFVEYFPQEGSIDIEKLVEFYNKSISSPNLKEDMHNYAKDKLSWEIKMEEVLDVIIKQAKS